MTNFEICFIGIYYLFEFWELSIVISHIQLLTP